ncbi:hypothetical protein EV421DRAFT_1739938 [Armillaria borealis]|uniref:Uncharacterized protein n=1 Tax=Armillaria borealis TaxID=47425 RepID=A0AA39J7W3_9AGAR|nr:hypothetical protein EV421DRAFT_1739938 [Armillaria borealis]
MSELWSMQTTLSSSFLAGVQGYSLFVQISVSETNTLACQTQTQGQRCLMPILKEMFGCKVVEPDFALTRHIIVRRARSGRCTDEGVKDRMVADGDGERRLRRWVVVLPEELKFCTDTMYRRPASKTRAQRPRGWISPLPYCMIIREARRRSEEWDIDVHAKKSPILARESGGNSLENQGFYMPKIPKFLPEPFRVSISFFALNNF